MIKNLMLLIAVLACVPMRAHASDLANPANNAPDARIAVGVSYHCGGYTITNDSVPVILNRIHVRATYAPLKAVNFGVDIGTASMEVDSLTKGIDTFRIFHGNFGLSAGAHVKLSTPFFANDLLAVVGLAQASYFSSENKYKAAYGGIDANGAVGVQLHIKDFGFITLGPQLYFIEGSNRGADGRKGSYSNISNLRGWLAIDFYPKMGALSSGRPYISFEFSATPKADIGGSVPIRECGFSIAIGTITKRLYGEETDVEWSP
jgi:hypothetical protein